MVQQGPLFYAAEIGVYRASTAAPATDPGYLAAPRLALAQLSAAVEVDEVLRASDLGYRTPPGDPAGAGGVLIYPPRLETAFELDRSLQLPPEQSGVAIGWGNIRLSNADRSLDRLAGMTADARTFRILSARKRWDAGRGIETDPPYSSLVPLFAGVATNLYLGDGVLEVGVRDASYWLERSLQSDVYGGTGGLDGTADMAGRLKPKARGGSSVAPIRNVSPVLVDPIRRIYQYSDAPGVIVALYEGGLAGGIVNAGDVSDLTSGSVAGGYYRTDNARGLLQLGATPVRAITLDVIGKFASGATASTAASLALRLLQEDVALPANLLDAASFAAVEASASWTSGFYWDGATAVDAASALGILAASLGAKVVPTRWGGLRLLALRAPAAGAAAGGSYGIETLVDVKPMPLPAGLAPPLRRARIGYGKAHTVQATDLAPTVTAAERQRLAAGWQYAARAAPSSTILTYRRPNDGNLVETALQIAADAGALADAVVALWGVPRLLYAVTVPIEVALRHDLGDLLALTYPVAGLAAGATGRIVGEQIRSHDQTATLLVLV